MARIRRGVHELEVERRLVDRVLDLIQRRLAVVGNEPDLSRQVGPGVAFRLFGRRVFRMAPIHHHFELAGWPEFTVIVRLWILAGLAVAFGVGLFYADFLARGGVR